MAKPRVSLIVPVHNQIQWLKRCFASIDAQTFRDFEVLLVDDGSSDGSADLVDAYAASCERAKVLRHDQCKGLSAARNTGIQAARGDYLAFLDSDDWIEPNFLTALYEAAVAHGAEVAQLDYVESFDESPVKQPAEPVVKTLTGLDAAKDMLRADKYAVWCRMYRADLVRSLGDVPFVVGLTCEDRVFNMQVLPKSSVVAQSNVIGYHYFQNKGSISLGGLTRRGLDLLEADKLMVESASATGDAELLELAKDRQAKGAYSLLVKWARFGITDDALQGEEANSVLDELWERFRADYPRLMASQLSAAKRAVAWELYHAPSLAKAEFSLYNKLSGSSKKEG